MLSYEDIIVEALKEAGCTSQDSSMSPEKLVEKCAGKGLTDEKAFEAAIVSLIDQDVVEYEIDDQTLKTTDLWLL